MKKLLECFGKIFTLRLERPPATSQWAKIPSYISYVHTDPESFSCTCHQNIGPCDPIKLPEPEIDYQALIDAMSPEDKDRIMTAFKEFAVSIGLKPKT